MRRQPALLSQTLRAASIALLLMTCSAGAHAQDTPTPDQLQTIQKCKDATAKLNTLITASFTASATATANVDQIKTLTSSQSSPASETFPELTKLANLGFPDALKAQSKDLSDQAAALLSTCGKDATTPPELADAQHSAEGTSQAATKRGAEVALDADSLNAALDSIPPFAGRTFDALGAKLSPDLKNLQVPADKQPLLDSDQRTLGRTLPAYVGVLEQMLAAKTEWDLLKTSVALKARPDPVTAVQTNIKNVDDALKAISANLAGWVTAMDVGTADPKKRASDAVSSVLQDSAANSTLAVAEQKNTSQALAKINTVLDLWPRLAAALKEQPDINVDDLANKVATLANDARTLQSLVARLADALEGDARDFTEDVVHLFYYTEVEKLMRSLNEGTDWVGGNNAATAAASARDALLDAESRVTQARGEVADLQFELAKLQEQQRQSDAALGQLQLLKANAARIKGQRASDLLHATDALTQAQTESDADPNDPKKKAQLQKAAQRKNTAEAKAADATAKDSDAQTTLSQAEAQQTSSNADQNSLAARIEMAKSKLIAAQQNLGDLQRSAYRAAINESDAFAAARDQSPYLEAQPLAVSLDPVKRVALRGYPDRNLILIRGKAEDVAAVKRVVSAFDEPAPQARLTLWSFEISAEQGKRFLWFKKPETPLNTATALVDESLGLTRGQIADATLNLRRSINEAVSAADTGGPSAPSSCSAQLGLPPDSLDLSEKARWRRFRFYSPAVLIQAGVNMADAASFKDAVLPDPAATITIGEALMILALSCAQNREQVFNDFLAHTKGHLATREEICKGLCGTAQPPCFWGTAEILQVPCATAKLPQTPWAEALRTQKQDERGRSLDQREQELEARAKEARAKEARKAKEECEISLEACKTQVQRLEAVPPKDACPSPEVDADFVRFPTLSVTDPLTTANEGLTDTQLEIVRALRSGKARKILLDLARLRGLIARSEDQYDTLKAKTLATDPNFPGRAAALRACMLKSTEIESLYNRYNYLVNTQLRRLYPADSDRFQLLPGRADFAGRVNQEFQSGTLLQQAGPRVAAADEMLKRMMSRLEDDLDQIYVQPMLKDLRAKLVSEGLTIGIVQRTSVLATNRLKARVDPKGMYDLSVGEQQDLLASIGQLASIYLSAQTGGALGAFGTLNSLNQKQEQHIYGVTTGSKFEVTPIFDPSGQALRFKFDYVSNSLIQNPKGTVDPTMPSLRHTINTEVQLSNLEIREISRYESNAKLGIPTRYWGGIPILTDIPGLKPIPIIGWFVRRAGSNAEVQQSVIFGQTTIYPTIGSIVELLQTGN